ncbi:MAG TPA: hypothetical protein P5121_22010 [Caldilineaceae bacterium]|nr:hypothetical protein [Caldilineaceae bacterium]
MNIFPLTALANQLRLAAIALALVVLTLILVPAGSHNLAATTPQLLADLVASPGPMPPIVLDPVDEPRPDPSSPGLGI